MLHYILAFMAFYIRPPRGNIPLDKLFHFGEKRLQFLHQLYSTAENKLPDLILSAAFLEKADCLIEGTSKDKVSHFLLRLLCMEKGEMQEFFIQGETILFSLRLQFHNFRNIRKTLQIASYEIHDILSKCSFICESYKQSLLAFLAVKEQLELPSKDPSHSQEIKVPFVHALNFVKDRLAPVHQGYVSVSVDQVRLLLTNLFEQSLIEAFVQLKSSACKDYAKEDSRIRNIQCRLQAVFAKLNQKPSKLVSSSRKILHSELDHVSKNFPLCMRHLHNVLRQRHRLKHKSRVQYTLFLKDIGVPCEEAIKLFEEEYSQIPKSCNKHSTCLHSWTKDKNRYIYNIRHLYGKEGACNKYRGHSCQTLLSSNMTASEEGGCPFAHFDKVYLQDLLTLFGEEPCDIEDLVNLSAEGKYQSACASNLVNILKKQADKRTLLTDLKSGTERNEHDLRPIQQNQAKNFEPNDDVLMEVSTPYKGAENLKSMQTGQNSNELFMSLSNLIVRPSDFYEICSNEIWLKTL